MHKKKFNIGSRELGLGCPPFLIAEMSGNHNQSLERSLEIVRSAAKAGASAIKLQTFKPETMTIDSKKIEFTINDKESLWFGKSLYELYKIAQTPWEWHEPIFKLARELGIEAFSTPFDDSSVDFLEMLNVPCYKIASFECTDLPLIAKVASTRKPLIISTGMASIVEIEEAVETARNNGCKDLVLLKCTSTYPASPRNSNILTIPDMLNKFGCHIGLSDHTMGFGVAVASVALGSVVIEKHLTLKRSDGGIDSKFSLEPKEFTQLAKELNGAYEGLGEISYGAKGGEIKSMQFRRSIYVVKNIKNGEIFNSENIRIIRPGFGLPPKWMNLVLGKKASIDLEAGTALKRGMIVE